MGSVDVEGLSLGPSSPCFIIAEIGQNHQGSLSLAKQLILKAKECGASCVKFQKSSLPHKFTQAALEWDYDSPHAFGGTYGDHKSALELSHDDYKQLADYSRDVGILFTASAMDEPSADFLADQLNVPFIKIGSGDTNNFPLLEHVAKKKKPVFLSTGMTDLKVVKKAAGMILREGCPLVLLHCVSAYPTPLSDVNLNVLRLYEKEFPGTMLGYSGHEPGITVPLAAVALGAKVIEKHFTLDKHLKGSDHASSLDPSEFKGMVDGIREVELALGLPSKKILASELPCQSKLGKSVVTAKALEGGTALSLDHLAVKVSRPHGIQPQEIYSLVGRKLGKNLEQDVPLHWEDLI